MSEAGVMLCTEVGWEPLRALLARFGLELIPVADGQPISGSYWGDSEAGLIGRQVFVRADTPLHSLLHEACHTICVDPERRQGLHTEAGGDDTEENAVCYLQLLLADHIPHFGRSRAFHDMDHWGYSFRLGSAQAWFKKDAADARQFLRDHKLVDENDRVLFRLRN